MIEVDGVPIIISVPIRIIPIENPATAVAFADPAKNLEACEAGLIYIKYIPMS